MQLPLSIQTFPFSLCALVLLAACGNDSDPAPVGNADFLVTDAPTDELAAFSARVLELRLVRADGSSTPNVLAAPTTIELLSLQGISEWLASTPIATGTYTGLTATFDPASVKATAFNGSNVVVQVASSTLQTTLPAPVDVAQGGYVRFLTDLDVAASLTGDVSSGTIQFNASGSTSSSDGSFEAPIDEIKGVVTSLDASASVLVVNAFADGDFTLPLGNVAVTVNSGTVLVDDNQMAFANVAAFFAFLVPGQTLLEVHGNLSTGGSVNATRIEVEDQLGGISGGDTLVRLEGLVQSLDPSGAFDLLIQDIDKGQAIVEAVLANLSNPSTVRVGFDAGTKFEFDDDIPTTSASLANGQTIDVRFAVFQNEPFPASQIEIDLTPTVGVPALVAPDGTSLQIASHARRPLHAAHTVGLQEFELLVDVPGQPRVEPSELHPGQLVRLAQVEPGRGSRPRGSVRPGQLVGAQVVAFDPAERALYLVGGQVRTPFAGLEQEGTYRVDLSRCDESHGALFKIGARVDLLGLATEVIGEVRAFQITATP